MSAWAAAARGDTYEPDDTCDKATALRTDGTPQDPHLCAGRRCGLVSVHRRRRRRIRHQGTSTKAPMPTRRSPSSTAATCRPASAAARRSGSHSPRAARTTSRLSITTPAPRPIPVTRSRSPRLLTAQASSNPTTPAPLPTTSRSAGAAQRHRFCKPNDEDWVKFTVQAGASYTVRATASGAQANPTLVGSFGDGAGDSVSGNPLQITAPANGTFYVRVTNQPPTAYGPTTDYDLAVTTTSCTPDAFEPDNGRGEAKACDDQRPPRAPHRLPGRRSRLGQVHRDGRDHLHPGDDGHRR